MDDDVKEVRTEGYSPSRDLEELAEYKQHLSELRDQRNEIQRQMDRVQFYFDIRTRLTEMGVWEEVITQIHDYQVLFGDPEDAEYDTISLLKSVYFSVASLDERADMKIRGVPVKNYSYHFSWPEDPMPRLRGAFLKDEKLAEVKRRFMSRHFRQQLADVEKKVTRVAVPISLEQRVKPEKAKATAGAAN